MTAEKKGTERRVLPPEQIVKMLKSDDPTERATALDNLYPGDTVALIRQDQKGERTAAFGPSSHVSHLFVSLLWASQFIGEGNLGLKLGWVQDRREQAQRIVVPGSGQVPMMR